MRETAPRRCSPRKEPPFPPISNFISTGLQFHPAYPLCSPPIAVRSIEILRDSPRQMDIYARAVRRRMHDLARKEGHVVICIETRGPKICMFASEIRYLPSREKNVSNGFPARGSNFFSRLLFRDYHTLIYLAIS